MVGLEGPLVHCVACSAQLDSDYSLTVCQARPGGLNKVPLEFMALQTEMQPAIFFSFTAIGKVPGALAIFEESCHAVQTDEQAKTLECATIVCAGKVFFDTCSFVQSYQAVKENRMGLTLVQPSALLFFSLVFSYISLG
jgi:hypothetical protein